MAARRRRLHLRIDNDAVMRIRFDGPRRVGIRGAAPDELVEALIHQRGELAAAAHTAHASLHGPDTSFDACTAVFCRAARATLREYDHAMHSAERRAAARRRRRLAS